MNFYPHHIGDYMTATAHLTWLEDAAYRRLLDLYYSREQAIPSELAQACRLVRASSKDERKAVETVLREFFAESPAGWIHSRCDQEIVKAQEAAERARANGKKGGRPSKAKPKDNPEITQSVSVGYLEKSNSKAPITNPITNTNTSEAKASGADAPPAEIADPLEAMKKEIWVSGKALFASREVDVQTAGKILGQLLGGYPAEIVLDAVRAGVKAAPPDPTAYLKACCQRAAGERANVQKNSRHNGFDQTDYTEGVTDDGRIA